AAEVESSKYEEPRTKFVVLPGGGPTPMARRPAAAPPPRPTEAELEILGILWKHGPSTVRAVHDAMAGSRLVGYTTVLKLLQIMAEKGLVRRNETERAQFYAGSPPAERTQRG